MHHCPGYTSSCDWHPSWGVGWGEVGVYCCLAPGQRSVEVLCQPVKLYQRCIFKSKHDLQKWVATQTCSTASLGNFLEMQVLRPGPRLTETESLGAGPSICFNKLSNDSNAQPSWRITALNVCNLGDIFQDSSGRFHLQSYK